MSTRQVQVANQRTLKSSHVLIAFIISLASFLIGLSWPGGSVKTSPHRQSSSPKLGDTWNASNTTMMQQGEKAHIYFLLDRSGSMQRIASDVIGGFNSFVQEQQLVASDTSQLTMSLIQFDSQEPHEVVFTGRDISAVPPLTSQTFMPRSATPLFDALGRTISMASAAHVPNEHIVMVIFSDGKENASKEYSRKAVFDLIKAKRDDGWAFVFLGANQDSYAESSHLGFSSSNTQNFHFDSGGVASAYSSLSYATSGMRSKISGSSKEKEDANKHYDSEDFFEGVKSAEADYNSRANPFSRLSSTLR